MIGLGWPMSTEGYSEKVCLYRYMDIYDKLAFLTPNVLEGLISS